MKKCSKCFEEKEQDEFSKRGKGKYHTFCKKCANKKARANYDPEKERERSKRKKEKDPDKIRAQNNEASRRYREKNREKLRPKWREQAKKSKWKPSKEQQVKWVQDWQKRNPEKMLAASKLRWAVKSGKIKKPDICHICGKENKIEGHHVDYSRPYDVIWCCRKCHGMLDRVRRAQEEMTA